MRQAKATWVFYQLNTMNSFDLFLSEYRKEIRYISIVNALKMVLSSFFEKCQENPLLALEIIFPFPNKETIKSILTNYDFATEYIDDQDDYIPNNDDDEDEIEMEEFKKRMDENGWTKDQDAKLLEYYDIFKDDPHNLVQKLAKILNVEEEAVQARLEDKKLITKKQTTKDPLESKVKEPKDGFHDCKTAIKQFIRAQLDKQIEHDKIVQYLDHFHGVVDKYIEHENAKSKDAEFEM